MQLGKKQYLAIQYILEGKQITDIAKALGVARQTIYNWLDDEEFKTEVDTLRREIQTSAKNYVENNIKLYIDEIEGLALNKETSSKVKADLLKYLVDRVLGKTTTKVEVNDNNTNNTDNVNLDELVKEFEKQGE
ncbi:helix-turn-helix domain-containing protein [Clostridium sardiniense]|uniref:helix-turn-helix domain-containing protein n=1 Tax=Clostridium sardiniense TaxID=29369 RepID=UPI001958CAE2|nr:helix-turn-helix domain-containing protein [Clostridium sardiniense]MBM7836430.1 putative transcriptional regulator YheO [Clostridium sardiniense]